MICEKCQEEINIGDWPFCKGPGSHTPGHSNVIGDDIPGGYVVRHGLVNEDGSPMTFYSKSAMTKEAKRRGLVNLVEHKVDPRSGSDKNPWTTRWV